MDERTQALLRRWQDEGDAEAERDYLLARLRAGELSWLRIETAAYLGDEVAASLLGEDALALDPPKSGIGKWFEELPLQRSNAWRERLLLALFADLIADLPAELAEAFETLDVARAIATLEGGDPAARESRLSELERLVPGLDHRAVACGRALVSLFKHRGDPKWEVNPFGLFKALEASNALKKRTRAFLAGALYPDVLLEPADVAADDAVLIGSWRKSMQTELAELRAGRLEARDEELVHLGAIDPELARGVLAEVELPAKGKLKAAQGLELFAAYAAAKGWAEKRGRAFLAPSGAKRLKLSKSALAIEVRRDGVWAKKVTWANRKTGLVPAGARLHAALRAAAAD